MRVDQYLWCIRHFKSRSLASLVCKKGSVKVNGQTAKPSRLIYPSDTISIRKNQVWHQIKVLDIPKSRVGAKLVAVYCDDLTPKSHFINHEMQRLSKGPQRDLGKGRPTKKERREIDALHDKDANKENESNEN